MTGTMHLGAIQAFVHVAESGSFRGTAQTLGIPRSTLSRKIAELEALLGTRLLRRTTRSVTLTEAGVVYLRACQPALGALDEAARAITARAAEASGRLRITAAVAFGERYLGPLIERYLREHPRVDLEVVLSDRQIDLVQEGFDLAFRAGAVGDTSLVARELGRGTLRCVASRSYLRAHPPVRHPRDLVHHTCIVYPPLAPAGRWTFNARQRTVHAPVRGRLLVNSLPLALEAAIRSLGVARVPEALLPALHASKLVEVLAGFAPPPSTFYLVYRSGTHVMPRLRAFIDIATAELALLGPVIRA